MASNRDLRNLQEDETVQDAFSSLVSGGRIGYKTVIERKKEILKCNYCHKILSGEEKFCPECGTRTGPDNLKMNEIAIVYPVAGLSKRFGGKIKQFAEVGPNNEKLIEISLNQAINAGISKIIFVVGEKTEKPFKELFKDKYNNIPIFYTFQNYDKNLREKPWGTLDALCSARNILNCPFIFCNGDDLYGEDSFKILVKHLSSKKTSASIGYKLTEVLPDKGKVNRAIFKLNYDEVMSLEEKFNVNSENLFELGISKDSIASMNLFAFQKEDLENLNSLLDNFKKINENDREIECLIQHEISNLISQGKMSMQIYQTPDKWYGVTNLEDEEIVRKQLSELTNK